MINMPGSYWIVYYLYRLNQPVPMALILSKIQIYPIKSCGGISLSSSKAESRGLQYDRRWMLIDVIGRCITQRESSAMALMRIELHKDFLVVYHTDEVDDQILVPFLNAEELSNSPRLEVTLWDDICEAIVYPDFINKWFSNKINMDCRLVYMPDDSIRKVDPRYAADGEITSFSDGYPILLLGQASLDDLNQRMADPIPINRFRPNLVFTGGAPYQEDDIESFTIDKVQMKGVKLCARCNIPTINQDTGISKSEPTATLATYRLVDKKILFGQNVLIKNPGTIKIGDELVIH